MTYEIFKGEIKMQTQDKVQLYKEVMGNYPTGVTVITTLDGNNEPVGLTANSFASVSIDPLLILWSIDKGVTSLEAFKNANGFAVHVLTGDQKDLCKVFSSKDVERFNHCEWSLSEYKLPIISENSAVLQCETYKIVEGGDHLIMIGSVKDIQLSENKEPMLYHRRELGFIPEDFYKAQKR